MNNIPTSEQKRKQQARRALRKKIATLDDTIKKSLAKTRYMRIKKQRTQSQKKMAIIIAGALVIAGLVYMIFAPRKGGMDFALCKTFVELRVEYPQELRYTYAHRFPDGKFRLWYVMHDSFGQKQIEKMDCFFKRNRNGQIYMQKAEINRGQIEPEDIRLFNLSIPGILENPPDLTLPRGLPGDLKRFYRTGE